MTDRFHTFAVTIGEIHRNIQKIKSLEMHALGLKSTHAMCLYTLGQASQGLTAAQLCRLCKEDKAAISRSVTELIQGGYIQLDTGCAKRSYRSRIFLTEKGAAMCAYIDRRVQQVLDTVGGELEEGQREEFYRTLLFLSGKIQAYAQQLALTPPGDIPEEK